MYQYLWSFFAYAFLGWCMEVSFAALTSGRFVNRGFLNGPVCPIYGCGAVIVLFCLEPLKDHLFWLFVGSVILTSALEWLTGFVLEKIFHERWWDYSDMPFNLGGYICPLFSLAWGFACLFVVKLLHPTILFAVYLIPHTLGLVLLAVMGLVLAVDLIATVQTIVGINRRLAQIDQMARRIKEASNEFGGSLAEHVLDAAEKGADLKEDLGEWKEELEDWHEDVQQKLEERRMDRQMDLGELREDLGEWKDALDSRAALAVAGLEQRREDRHAQLAAHRAAKREQLAALKAELEELLEPKSFGQRRMLKAFPRMHSTRHTAAMERLRRRLDRD